MQEFPERRGPSGRVRVEVRTLSAADPPEDVVRRRVAALVGADVDEVGVVRVCRRCGSPRHGRPHVLVRGARASVGVSLSRSPTLSIVALAVGAAVGVDVEEVRATGFDGFSAVALDPRERAGTSAERARTWTRKESLLKALGVGLEVAPGTVRLTGPGEPPAVLECPGLDQAAGRPWMSDLSLGAAHAGCVTVLADRRPRVTLVRAVRAGPPRAAR